MNKKTATNPKGAGRPGTGIKRIKLNISGQPEQIQRLKEKAAAENKTASQFVFEKTGVSSATTNIALD